jgi:Flp pilus assembly protein TadD
MNALDFRRARADRRRFSKAQAPAAPPLSNAPGSSTLMVDVTTKRPRRRGWMILACACAAVAAGFVVRKIKDAPRLPPDGAYERLPAIFNTALHAKRARVRENGFAPEDLRSLAHLYQANRLYGEARSCYRIRALAAALTAQDHYYLADIAQYQGDLEGAQSELRAVLAAEPRYLPARLELADSLFKSGKDAEAEKEYLAELSFDANQPQAQFGLARIELLRGDDAAAVARLERLMGTHPEMTSGAGLLAQVLDRRGETARAAAMTQWSRQQPEPVPADPWTDALLLDCYDLQRLALKFEEYFASGQIEQAVPLLHRVEELDPKSPIPQLLRGWTYARDHQDLEAVREYRSALEKGGDPEKICPYMVQSLFVLGKVPEAAALMADAYAKKPDSIPILTTYADVAVRQGDTATARRLLSKVVQKEPYLYAANANLAKILWAAGDRDAAAQCLERIARVSSGDVPSRALLGEYYLGKNDPVSAIAPLEEAAALERADAPAHKSLTSMLYAAYVRAGSDAAEKAAAGDALGFFDKAIHLSPDEAGAYALKAGFCAQTKQYPAAADALTKLAALQPANATVYLSLGDVVYQEGAVEDARRDWRKALELSAEGDADLRAALERRINGPITEDTFR